MSGLGIFPMDYAVAWIVCTSALYLAWIGLVTGRLGEVFGGVLVAFLVAVNAVMVMGLTSCAVLPPDVPPCPHPGLKAEWEPLRDGLLFPDLTGERD